MGKRKPATVDSETFHSKSDEAVLGNAVVGLVRQEMGLSSVWKFVPPPLGAAARKQYAGLRGSTPNKRGLWRVWYYGWAMRAGTSLEKLEARVFLCDFYQRQFASEGLNWAEPISSNHGQFWILIDAASRYLARLYGDAGLLFLTGKKYRQLLWLYQHLDDGTGHVISLGPRCEVSDYDVRNVEYALLDDHPQPRSRKNPGRMITEGGFWGDVYNYGAGILVNLLVKGDEPAAGCPEQPILRNELHIYRRGPDILAVFPKLGDASKPPLTKPILFWAGVIDGKVAEAPVHRRDVRELDNPYPLPVDVAGWQLTVVKGVSA